MRVLFISEFFHPVIGGVEVRALRLLQSMHRRGHEITVVTNRDQEQTFPAEGDYDGVRVFRFPLATAIGAGDLPGIIGIKRQVAKLKRLFRPELVHAFVYGPMIQPHLETERGGPVPLIASFTQWVDGPIGRNTLLGRALRAADWVTVNAASLLSHLRTLAPDVGPKSSVIYSGNAWPDLEPAPLALSAPRLLCIGRLIDEKGFDLAIDAMPRILDGCPAARLIVAGDGPGRAKLEALASALDIDERVQFVGWVRPDEVPRLMNEVSMVIVPSRWQEVFATVAIQAAQLGRPCIATDRGGMREAVRHGETGLIVPGEDAGAIADAALALIGNPPEAQRLGRNAREHARAAFSWDRYVDEFETLYERLVASRRGSGPR